MKEKRIIVFVCVFFSLIWSAPKTIIVQDGVDGYSGCVDVTLFTDHYDNGPVSVLGGSESFLENHAFLMISDYYC